MLENTKPKKEFGLASWAIDNSMTVFVIITIILVGGIAAYNSMPRESFPEILENKIYISAAFPGNSSVDVEKLITDPLEDEIKNASGVIDVKSTSLQDYTMIVVELDDNLKLEEAKQRIKDKVDIAISDGNWPTLDNGGKVDPFVFDLNIAEEIPILNINLTGPYNPQELKAFAEILEKKIESLAEIKAVDIVGVDDKEVEVAVDLAAMSASQVSFNDILQAISNNNKTISGGTLNESLTRTNLKVNGEYKTPEDILNVAVKTQNGNVFIRDIASVHFQAKETSTFARERMVPVVSLNVKKRSGQNMIEAVEKIKDIVKSAENEIFPSQLKIELTGDQSLQTQNQVDDLVNNIIFGVILVVGVLLFFLGFKNAMFVGIAIPLSMLMSLMIIQFAGITLNTMVLFALVMGLGMLVDNGIVVVENVFSLHDSGLPLKVAAKQGVGEVAWPIIASTATTLAAFFPLGLWPGTIGKFMIYFPITLSVVLFSSLFVALVINSMITSKYLSLDNENIKMKSLIINSILFVVFGFIFLIFGFFYNLRFLIAIGNLSIFIAIMLWVYKYFLFPLSNVFQNKLMPKIEKKYENFLSKALVGKRTYSWFFGTFLLLILSFIAIGIYSPKVDFFPDNQAKQAYVYVEFPEGTDIIQTNNTVKQLEKIVIKILDKYAYEKEGETFNFLVESIIAQVGKGAGNPQTDSGSQADIPYKGKITVTFRDIKDRVNSEGDKISSNDVLEEIRTAVSNIPGPIITVEKDQAGPPRGYPVSIQITGEDYSKLIKTAEEISSFIKNLNIEGLEGINTDANKDLNENIINIDRELAGSLNVNASSVGQTLRGSIFGLEASTFKENGEDYPINVRAKEEDRHNPDILWNQPVTFRNQASGQLVQIPISAIATIENENTFNKIKHEDYNRVLTLFSNVKEGANANEIVNRLKKEMINYPLPKDISYRFSGEQEEQDKNSAFLLKALLFAIFGITLIIVMQFNSISKPFIIITAVVFSLIGVLFGMIFMQLNFVIIMTMMGVISLAGIIVNNAIVLIDYTQLLIDRKKEELGLGENQRLTNDQIIPLVIAAGKSRIRPVLLTAITTVLGLIPLAIGLNIDFFSLFSHYNPKIYIGGENVIFWGPLAKTVINGLIFATFLTLIIVPVMFTMIEKYKNRNQKSI